MNTSPLVSVIIPCYNHEKFVKQAISSALAQTYQPVQLIVIDDGSKDNSVEVIKEIQSATGFLFIAQENKGLSPTLNYAISMHVTGELVCILASDDFWAPDKLAEQVDYLVKNREFDVVFSNAFLVNEASEITGAFEESRLKHNCRLEDLMLDKCGIPALTAMVRKTIYEEVGLYDETLVMEDWDMWMRIAEHHKIAYLPLKLAFYRMHGHNISSKFVLMMNNRLAIIHKWKEKYPVLYAKAMKYWHTTAFIHLSGSDKQAASGYLRFYPDKLVKKKFLKAYLRYLFTKKSKPLS